MYDEVKEPKYYNLPFILILINLFCGVIHVISMYQMALFVDISKISLASILGGSFWLAIIWTMLLLYFILLVSSFHILAKGNLLCGFFVLVSFISFTFIALLLFNTISFSMHYNYPLNIVYGSHAVATLNYLRCFLHLIHFVISAIFLVLRVREKSAEESKNRKN